MPCRVLLRSNIFGFMIRIPGLRVGGSLICVVQTTADLQLGACALLWLPDESRITQEARKTSAR